MQSSLPPDLLINSSSWGRGRKQERVAVPFMSYVAAPAAPVGLGSAPTSRFDQLNARQRGSLRPLDRSPLQADYRAGNINGRYWVKLTDHDEEHKRSELSITQAATLISVPAVVEKVDGSIKNDYDKLQIFVADQLALGKLGDINIAHVDLSLDSWELNSNSSICHYFFDAVKRLNSIPKFVQQECCQVVIMMKVTVLSTALKSLLIWWITALKNKSLFSRSVGLPVGQLEPSLEGREYDGIGSSFLKWNAMSKVDNHEMDQYCHGRVRKLGCGGASERTLATAVEEHIYGGL